MTSAVPAAWTAAWGAGVAATPQDRWIFLRFVLCNAVALLWAVGSFLIARTWIGELSGLIGAIPAYLIVLFIAIIPGYLNLMLLMSILVYRQSPLNLEMRFPPVSLLIAAYNEEDVIAETLRGVRQQEYPAPVEVILIDDGSTDRTIDVARENAQGGLRILLARHRGKAEALNLGLEAASYPTIVTIDADTFLYKNALQRLIARLYSDPKNAAVAGHVLAKNERGSPLARLQTWDYFLAISAVKRQQGLFQGTLVAQGAFSAYLRPCLYEVGRWENRIGEDIVLTWALLKKGYHVGYEPTAFAFTNVPLKMASFSRQRQRWARGMIEGFKSHLSIIWRFRGYSSFFVAIDLLYPLIDFFYTFVFLPGVVLALLGRPYIAGVYTLLLLPMAVGLVLVMYFKQKKLFDEAGLRIRHNPWGLVGYILFYQLIMSPICVAGYMKEVIGWRRKW
jgi:poly-beta-1,6-N-acetyl-D-glucosamine synthase